MESEITKIYEDKEFISIIDDIINNETVQKMKDFRQHYNVSCFEHCLCVSYYSYLICKKLHLDYKSVARAGMLHDLFLYDWRKKVDGRKGLHAFTHPKTALENSLKLFGNVYPIISSIFLNKTSAFSIFSSSFYISTNFAIYKQMLLVPFFKVSSYS